VAQIASDERPGCVDGIKNHVTRQAGGATCCAPPAPWLRAARDFAKKGKVPSGVDEPGIYCAVRSGDFVTDAKISWRDAYDMQMRAAARPLRQAAE
jgi:hypothetical protein